MDKKWFELSDLYKMFLMNLTGVVTMIVTILPVVLVIGTLGLLVAQYTPLFQYFGKPFVPLLEMLQIPEAVEASECIVVDFAEMILPSLLSTTIENELTRFFIASLSVVQLIHLSETGALLIACNIPVGLAELFVIFILRTMVTLPVIAMLTHLFF